MNIKTLNRLKAVFKATVDTVAHFGTKAFLSFVKGRLKAKGKSKVKRKSPRFACWKPKTKKVPEPQTTFPDNPKPGKSKMIINYHHADKAGRHVDIHIKVNGRYLSFVKRLPDEFKVNLHKDRLTADTKSRIMDLVKQEFDNGAWLGQSQDHIGEAAGAQWFHRSEHSGYGEGPIREKIFEADAEILHSHESIKFRCLEFEQEREAYLFKIMEANENRPSNILKIGFHRPKENIVGEKLSPAFDKDMDNFAQEVGHDGTITVKKDGASAFFSISKKGFAAWSPRISKKTGRPISYTNKLPIELRSITSKQTVAGMMEIMLYRKEHSILDNFAILRPFGPFSKEIALSAPEIGGMLNSHTKIPDDVKQRHLVYVVRKDGRNKLSNLPYEENIKHINRVAEMSEHLEPVELISLEDISSLDGEEGVVGTPAGMPLDKAARKFKFRDELQDGIITDVSFEPGNKGGITGVINYVDDKTGKRYNTSSGLTHNQKLWLAKNADKVKGAVIKLRGFRGHRGRAVVFDGFHEGKGIAVHGFPDA